MAITAVRARVSGEWITLTYNEATKRYEGQLEGLGTSANQPGGYYAVEVEADNDSGKTARVTGQTYPPLRQVVREIEAPRLELVFPPPGYLTTSAPTFTFSARDEPGGSGIDPGSAAVTIDGVLHPHLISGSDEVYTITVSPAHLGEGPHTITAEISDRDKNRSAVSAAYLVDTVPPELRVKLPDSHRVVDWPRAVVSGIIRDATAGPASVTVNGEPVPFDAEGRFEHTVSLEVGENTITVTAADKAGWTATQSFWMLRLITDRTQADVDTAKSFWGYTWDDMPPGLRDLWPAVVRGMYNTDDLNRVGVAVDYLTRQLLAYGYYPRTAPKTDWTEAGAPTAPEAGTYLANVESIKAQFPPIDRAVPPDLEEFRFGEANDIEAVLVAGDSFFPLMDQSVIYSGEAFAGEF